MWKSIHTGLIAGPPVAMGRPRLARSGHAYTPPKSREYMQHAIDTITNDWGDAPPLANMPLKLCVQFIHRRPARIKGPGRVLKTTKPDIDNLIKMVMDAISKSGVWVDDNLVVEIQATDYYANAYEPPHTMYTIYNHQPEIQ